MNVYLFMGTHFPEMNHCFKVLADQAEVTSPIPVWFPRGFAETRQAEENLRIDSYDPGHHWVWGTEEDGIAFLVVDPRQPLVPQLEAIADDLAKCRIYSLKVVTCVDCAAAGSSRLAKAWFEACIYFSDIVLLGNRAEAAKSFVRDFEMEFRKQCYPCQFLMLKGAGVPDSPHEILSGDARRLSQLFDPPESEPVLPGLVIEASCDLDLEEQEDDPLDPLTAEDPQLPSHVPDVSPWIVP